MIVSENRAPSLDEFRSLMARTDALLNEEASGREAYYRGRNGTQLEEDVLDALTRCAAQTPFDGSIRLVSGAAFPDIVADRLYGVEVKSTNKNHWKSIGSSILESTRDQNVERIFLTFGKLGAPVAFRSRPYEECLSGISVTHYPRYQIDMELGAGETIFDKMGIPYDTLRQMENPVVPVSHYYRQTLRPGQSLWWAADANVEETAAPPTVRLWNTLSSAEKNYYTVQGYAFFPEILGHSNTKYQRFALWLATNCSIINTNIRDQFSAGGKVDIVTANGVYERMPAAFGRIQRYKDLIVETIISTSPEILKERWELDVLPADRLRYWCRQTAICAGTPSQTVHVYYDLLKSVFNL